jgi:hypothetical protein
VFTAFAHVVPEIGQPAAEVGFPAVGAASGMNTVEPGLPEPDDSEAPEDPESADVLQTPWTAFTRNLQISRTHCSPPYAAMA